MPANKTPSTGPRRADQRAATRAGGDESATTAAATPTEAGSSTAAASKAGAVKAGRTKAAPSKAAPTPAAASRAAASKAVPSKAMPSKDAPAKAAASKAAPSRSGASRPATKSTGRPSGNRASAARAARASATGPARNRPKSLVVKRRTPWGLIFTCILVVVFAAAVIGYAVTRPKKVSAGDAPYVRNEIAAAKAIPGMLFKKHVAHTHITTLQKYDTSPPTGGDHSAIWADCSGTVYPKQIANENAVHPLEHGAVWITYRPGLDAKSVASLAKLVTGVNYMFMTPYAGLKTPISLQAWNYQLFVNSASDPRIKAFIKALRNNPGTTPEYPGNCVEAAFKANPSTPGHPTF